MNLTIIRGESGPTGTAGIATLINDEGCVVMDFDTLELPWRSNRSGVSCVKADTYKASRFYSPTMRRELWRLEDKHGRSACLIHHGNWAGDTSLGLETQVHGCTLVGRGYCSMQTPKYEMQLGIMQTVGVLNELMAATYDKTVIEVTYEWQEKFRPVDDV